MNPATPAVPSSEENSLNTYAASVTALGYAAAAIIYFVIGSLSIFFPVPWDNYVTISVTFAVGVLALAGWLRLRVFPASPEFAHTALFSLLAVMALQNGIVLYVIADPIHSGNQILTAFAAAFFLADRKWYYPMIGLIALFWLPAASQGWNDESSGAQWHQWARMLLVGMALSIAYFEARRLSMLRLYRLKLEADVALASAESANVQRLAMERMMQEAQRRESLGVLAGGIAHDFNNLLAIIRGNLELLQQNSEDPVESAEMMADMEQACVRAISLTQQMLVYAGKSEPSVIDLELGTQIHHTVRLMESSMPVGLRLELDGDSAGPPIRADKTLLDQLLINLMQNAVEACREQGTCVQVSWGVVALGDAELAGLRFANAPEAGNYAFLEVIDDGIGMNQETSNRIFEPFFSTKPEGNGLGLAIVRGVCEAHSAGMRVSSDPGNGTTICIVFPLSD